MTIDAEVCNEHVGLPVIKGLVKLRLDRGGGCFDLHARGALGTRTIADRGRGIHRLAAVRLLITTTDKSLVKTTGVTTLRTVAGGRRWSQSIFRFRMCLCRTLSS